MKRREFITLVGGVAAGWPLAPQAQQPKLPVIGWLDLETPETEAHLVTAFRRGLNEAGFVEGRNVAVDYRWANNERTRYSELAADLVRLRVALIVANSNGLAQRAKAATDTIPIVFRGGGDPVSDGLVASLDRPGGNVTGFTSVGSELGGKQLGLLTELVPGAAPLAVLVQPTTPFAKALTADIQAAGAALGRRIEVLSPTTSGEIDTVFARAVQMRAGALLITTAGLFDAHRIQLAGLAIDHKVPILASNREFAEVGGLMSYGPDWSLIQRQVGIYAGRILKGEKPADLPVMQPTRFEFVINLQTAKILGIAIPPKLLALADEVIE